MNTQISQKTSPVNWRQVGLFLGLTFAISWAIDLALQLTNGYQSSAAVLFLQLQMLIPAAVAILLSLFAFKDSPLYFRNYRERPRWFFLFYLAFTLTFLVLAAWMGAMPSQAQVISGVAYLIIVLTVILVVVFRLFNGRERFAQAGLSGGHWRDWLVYGLLFGLYYATMTALNAIFKLGTPADVPGLIAKAGMNIPVPAFLLVMGLQTAVLGPLLGILIAFGEEYGWRKYLQGELIKLGKKRGVLLVGLIWSVWHFPAIWMGHNYPGQPVWGSLMMTVYTTLLAFVLGYVMLKTNSVWLVAFLHAVNNQVLDFFVLFFYAPGNFILSFTGGIYGALILAVIVFFLLRDPIWRDQPASAEPIAPAQTTVQPAA